MRKLAWFTTGFTAACLLCALLYGSWILPAGIIALVISGILAAVTKKSKLIKRPFLVTIGFTIALLWFGVYDAVFILVPRVADGQTAVVSIEASDYSVDTDRGISVEGYVRIGNSNYRVKAYLNDNTPLQPGDRVTGAFRFRLTASGAKNGATNHQTEGIFLLAYQTSDITIDFVQECPIRDYPAKWRHDLLQRIDQCFSGEAAAFAKALLLGDRTDISYELNTAFRLSGISHIIAVSGLHVSILFGLLYTLTLKKKQIAFILCVSALFLFASIVGFTPSITRACIMQSLMLLAMLTNREYDRETALAFSVLVMLVFNPMTVLSVSFQLSVGCMVGIFLFSDQIYNSLTEPQKTNPKKRKNLLHKAKLWVIRCFSVTLSATFMTTPLVAYHFGSVSVIGILTNLLVLWVISAVFGGIIICLLLSTITMGGAVFLAEIISIPIYYILGIAKLLSNVPMGAIYTVSIYTVLWLIGVYLMIAVFLLQKKKRPLLLTCCLAITMLLSQCLSWAEPRLDELRVTALDVGQGQCIILQSDGRTFIVDCGGDYDKEAADIAAETLLSSGVSRVDGIIVSHYDMDHVGGMQYLLTRINADRLILPHIVDENGIAQVLISKTDAEVQYVQNDICFTFADTKLTVFGPISYNEGNESSLCVLFQSENCDILITGDREELGEMMLLHDHTLPELDLLVVGHHGASGAAGEKLLLATKPKAAIISVGENNKYGHPSGEVLNRLIDIGCIIYRTDLHGTVVFRR